MQSSRRRNIRYGILFQRHPSTKVVLNGSTRVRICTSIRSMSYPVHQTLQYPIWHLVLATSAHKARSEGIASVTQQRQQQPIWCMVPESDIRPLTVREDSLFTNPVNVQYLVWRSVLGVASASFCARLRLCYVEFMYLVFTRMPGDSYRKRIMSLLLCLCEVFRDWAN